MWQDNTSQDEPIQPQCGTHTSERGTKGDQGSDGWTCSARQNARDRILWKELGKSTNEERAV